MKKNVLSTLSFICACLFITSCNTATPEKYFDEAVLNTNMLMGFANDGMSDQLQSPSVKMDKDGKEATMLRSEVVATKVQALETDFEKLKNLKETKDTKEMLQASLAVYEYVLPVYKTNYVQLAKLYDAGAPKEQILATEKSIRDTYGAQFTALYDKLIGIGKLYAARHSIKVTWAL